MTRSSPERGRRRWRGWVSVFVLPLVVLGLACENGGQQQAANSAPGTAPDGPPITTWVKNKDVPLPQVTASISRSLINWSDGQQTFTITFTNNGKRSETVHAVVFASNEEITPPRRAVSPPTAYAWFSLAGSKDGKLTSRDIERHWKNNVFVSARGGKLPSTWQATLEPGETKDIDASHVLDETSPHPASKGKRLAKTGFTQYALWLFTNDGQLFDEQTIPAKQPPVERPSTAKKTPPPETRPEDPEELAAKQFKLALYYLEVNQPTKAKEKLQAILDKYPKTNSAKAARKLLKELQG